MKNRPYDRPLPLLAHLVPRFTDPEPAPTQALAYLLRCPPTAGSLVRLLAASGLESFRPGTIQAEERPPGGIPDLTLRDSAGGVRVRIENKFWAPLTDAQPVASLETLPEDVPAALLFIVPGGRMDGLWRELKRRCDEGKIRLGLDSGTDVLRWARSGPHTLAITSWEHVLNGLECAALEDPALQQDIAQLRGWTGRMDDVDAFLPLRECEVTAQDRARRRVNYSDLIPVIVDALAAEGIASTERLGSAHGYHWSGRYLRVQGKFGLWLGVHLKHWKRWGLTPVWSEHPAPDPGSGIENRIREAPEPFEEAQLDGRHLRTPIRLRTGVDRGRVIKDAVSQLRHLAERLRAAFPDESSPGGGGEPEAPA